jgi:Holliday junction resolvase RusA-like endonuclease
MNLKLILRGRPITKKNSQQIVRAGKSHMVLPSPQYRAYEKECLLQIPNKYKQRIDMPVNVQCVYYMPTRHKCDLVNLLEATCDILVKAGVVEDDHCRIICAHDGSRVDHDKYNPRVEITITSYRGIVQ